MYTVYILCRGGIFPPSLLSFFSFSFPCVKCRAEESGQGDSMFLVFILGTGITKYIFMLGKKYFPLAFFPYRFFTYGINMYIIFSV